MQDQDEYRRHSWEIEDVVGHPVFEPQHIKIEICTRCKAKRAVLHPHGIELKSEPNPLPEFCSIEEGFE